METALIVSSTDAGVKALFDLLRDLRLQDVQFAMNGGEARRRLAEKEYDLAVVNTPLRDEFGTDLACRIAETTAAGVALLVKADRVAEVNAHAESSGVFVLGKPLSRSMFQYTMRMMGTMERRLQLLKGENARLQQRIEEIRLVDRAKCMLIQYLSMTESQAHRYIEKQAMDRRVTRGEVARSILGLYDP